VSFEPVNINVSDRLGDPIVGVLVKVYDPTGTTFYTQATTDSDGLAAFLLETQSYTMRLYKFQVGFAQPIHFEVLASPNLNDFDVVGEPFILPIATDPRLCRCSGFFRDLDGSAKCYLDIHFIGAFDPILLDRAAVISEERHIRTDEKGYGQIDLIRGAEYSARVESIDGNWLRCIRVPDLASCNLPDLLLPIVERVVLSPEGPYDLAVGEELVVTPSVYDSAGVQLTGTAVDDVIWKSSDANILLVSPAQTTVLLRGNAAGAAQVLVSRKNVSIIKIPDLPIEGQPVDVTVS
jgi:hypothetical protein